MTTKTSYLFATIAAILAVTLASANTAYAYGPQDVENLTQRGEIVIDEIKELEKLTQTDSIAKKITILKEELKAILQVINPYGIYTYEQFAKLKASPPELPQSDAASCKKTCTPVLFFRSGFDWQMNTYFTGSTTANSWELLEIPMTKKLSTAIQSSWWGTDWSRGFLHAFVDHGTTANITVDMDALNDGKYVKNYPVYTKDVSAGTLVSFDEFKQISKWIPGKAKDHLVAAVSLNSIS